MRSPVISIVSPSITYELLREVGYSDAEIDRMIDERVLYAHRAQESEKAAE